MNELLDHDFEASIRAALAHDAERAPRAPQWEGPRVSAPTTRSSLRWVTVAASVIVVAAVGAVAFLVTRSDDPATIDGAPTPETTVAAPSTDPQWSPMAAPSIEPRSGYVSVPTDNGWFVWGGWTGSIAEGDDQSLNDGAYYDGATGEWTTLPAAPITNGFQAAYGVWTGTEVIVVVAYGEPQLAAFDPATFTWREIPVSDDLRAAWPQGDGHFARGWHRFAGGKLVMFFPNSSSGAPALLLLDPATGDWAMGATPPITSDDGTSGVAASSGQLFVAGMGQRGSDGVCSGDSTPLFIYDVATDTWNTSLLPHGNWQPAVVAWTGSGLLAGGGLICGSQTVMRTASLFDPATSTWTDVSDMTDDLWYSLVEPVVSDGRVIVAGESGRPSVYYPELDAWWSGPALFPGRPFGDLHLAAPDGRVMTWSASPLEPQDDGSFSCCTPDPAARALVLPAIPPEASPTPTTPAASTFVPASSTPATLDIAPNTVSGVATSDEWSTLPSNGLSPRAQQLTVATDSGIFEWGGYSPDKAGNDVALTDGAYYDGTQQTWRRLPPAPLAGDRGDAIGVWTGTEVIVVNGNNGEVKAAAFNPATFEWRSLADPDVDNAANASAQVAYVDGSVLLFTIIEDGNGPTDQATLLDLATGTWQPVPVPPVQLRSSIDIVPAGGQAIIVGQSEVPNGCGVLHLLSYTPATNTWHEIPSTPITNRADMITVWTGTEVFFGGGTICEDGVGNGDPRTDAHLLNPATGKWRTATDAPIGFYGADRYRDVWTGQSVAALSRVNSVLLYNPTTDTWHVTPTITQTRIINGEVGTTPVVALDHSIIITDGGLTGLGTDTCCDQVTSTYQYTIPNGF